MQRRTIIAIVIAFVVIAIVTLYFIFDPAESIHAPKCVFKTLTGYDCPSCGSQRALHAILNRQLLDAFLLNPFLFLATPYLALVAFTAFSKHKIAVKLKPIVQHRAVIWFYIVLYFVWWIIRNTPLWSVG